MRRVPRRHTAPRTVPWCECKHNRQTGYVQHPDHPEEYFVHSTCMKPTRRYWAVMEGRIVAGRPA